MMKLVRKYQSQWNRIDSSFIYVLVLVLLSMYAMTVSVAAENLDVLFANDSYTVYADNPYGQYDNTTFYCNLTQAEGIRYLADNEINVMDRDIAYQIALAAEHLRDNGFDPNYYKDGTLRAKGSCCFINLIWQDVFGVDLYDLEYEKAETSTPGEYLYRFLLDNGAKTGDLLWCHDDATGLSYNLIVLDYGPEGMWLCDGGTASNGGGEVRHLAGQVFWDETFYRSYFKAYFRLYKMPQDIFEKAHTGQVSSTQAVLTPDDQTGNEEFGNEDFVITDDFGFDTDASPTDEIQWHDEGLRQAVVNALGITDRPITVGDAQQVTSLKLNTQDESVTDIENIKDLQYFTNLTELQLNWNQITDISVLGILYKLEIVTLNTNKVWDLSPLAYHPSLRVLDISNNPVTTFEQVQYIEKLERLRVFNTGMSNESLRIVCNGLAKNQKITLLDCGGNSITDFSPLGALWTLNEVDIWSGNIDTGRFIALVSVLQDLPQLTVIHLRNNSIDNISAVTRLANLTEVDFINNQITDRSPLDWLNITTEKMDGNPLKDTSTGQQESEDFIHTSAFEEYIRDFTDPIKDFRYVDIDQNGIAELLCLGEETVYVATYDAATNKAVPLLEMTVGKAYPAIWYNTSEHIFGSWVVGGYYKEWDYYVLDGTSASPYMSLFEERAHGTVQDDRRMNDQAVSSDELYNKLDELENSCICFSTYKEDPTPETTPEAYVEPEQTADPTPEPYVEPDPTPDPQPAATSTYDVRDYFWENESIRNELGLYSPDLPDYVYFEYQSDTVDVYKIESTSNGRTQFMCRNTGDWRVTYDGLTIGASFDEVMSHFGDYRYIEEDDTYAFWNFGGFEFCAKFNGSNCVQWWEYTETEDGFYD